MPATSKRHPPLSYKNPIELLFIALPIVVCAANSISQFLLVSNIDGPWFAVCGAMSIVSMIALVASGLALVCAFPLTFFKRPKKVAQQTLAIAFWSIFILLGSLAMNGLIRSYAFDKLAERMAPLVQAIKHYEEENHHPPEKLTELVPKYIDAIPKTGMSMYSLCEYSVKPETDAAWQLMVPCSNGYLSFDEFFYWPKGNYPTRINGGWVERKKGWAYVHE